jgi:excinuclease ABC subunit B
MESPAAHDFVMANLIERIQKPTLILAHKQDARSAALYRAQGAVPKQQGGVLHIFYDYYQPEAYIPQTDTYIEKDSSVNDQIEKMRMHAVSSIVSRNDTIIVASISCIYSLGNPNYFRDMAVSLSVGKEMDRKELIRSLVDIQYERNDQALLPGRFRVRGDVIDVIPPTRTTYLGLN